MLFVPVIFFFYPETAGRSLEEIDIIFAKAHVEGRQPWRVAATMPKLSLQEIDEQSKNLGLFDENFDKDNFETKEDISESSSSEGLRNRDHGLFEKDSQRSENESTARDDGRV